MPRSKNRTEHKHHVQHQHAHGSIPHKVQERNGTARMFTIPVCLLFGAGMAWFATNGSALWVIIGAVAGAGIGYFIGVKMDQAFSKK